MLTVGAQNPNSEIHFFVPISSHFGDHFVPFSISRDRTKKVMVSLDHFISKQKKFGYKNDPC